MTPIRSSISKTSSDSLKANQTSNGVYPVRAQKTYNIINMRFEACTYIQLPPYGYKLSGF